MATPTDSASDEAVGSEISRDGHEQFDQRGFGRPRPSRARWWRVTSGSSRELRMHGQPFRKTLGGDPDRHGGRFPRRGRLETGGRLGGPIRVARARRKRARDPDRRRPRRGTRTSATRRGTRRRSRGSGRTSSRTRSIAAASSAPTSPRSPRRPGASARPAFDAPRAGHRPRRRTAARSECRGRTRRARACRARRT